MVVSFDSLLKEIGQLLNVELVPDRLNACRLKYPDGLFLQLEANREGTTLLLGTKIGALPPGRYRQDVLEQALKANTLDFHTGTFGYSKKNSELYLYAHLSTEHFTAKQIVDFISPFIEKARHWIAPLAANQIPPLDINAPTQKSSGMFGLAP